MIGLLALLGGITVYSITSKSERETTEETKTAQSVKKEDPYEGVQKDKIEKVKIAKKAVDEVIESNDEELERRIDDANKAIDNIGNETPELEAMQKAFSGIINVVQDPTIEQLQTARTNIANLSDLTFSNFLEKQFEDKLITIVSNKTNKTKEDIKKESQPLTPEQVKEKEEAKEKSEKEAKEKAERDRIEKEKAEQIAKDQAVEQEQANQNQAENNSNYVPPVDNGSDQNYAPPVNSNENSLSNNQISKETDNSSGYTDQIHQNNPDLPADYDPTGGGTTGYDLGDLGPGWW